MHTKWLPQSPVHGLAITESDVHQDKSEMSFELCGQDPLLISIGGIFRKLVSHFCWLSIPCAHIVK